MIKDPNGTLPPVTQVTKDYSQFDTFLANRDTSRQHINELKNSMRDNPDLLAVTPILVNENMRIIDGQHRFAAAKELGLPIYYNVLKGGTMQLARDMNNNQRAWTPLDWAKSYATEGDVDYQEYLKLRDEFKFGHNIVLLCANQGSVEGMHKLFRLGKFEIKDFRETRYRLDYIKKVAEILEMALNGRLVHTLNLVLNKPEVDRDKLLSKIRQAGNKFLKPAASQLAYMRGLEEIYNFNSRDDQRVRFY